MSFDKHKKLALKYHVDDIASALVPSTSISNFHVALGDIVVSVERAFSQAEEYGHSFEREMAFLVCHSMFHLLGSDHMTKQEEGLMMEKQNKVLEALGINR